MLLGRVLLLLMVTNIVASHSIIKNLPGFDGDLPFKLETGYVAVGKMEEVQLFYYFIESERSPKDDPLLLWLAGGPGCSGFSALVYETGPLTFDYTNSSGNKTKFLVNPYSWTKVSNIIFLDAPVGTGFSYATSWDGYRTGDLSSAAQTYEFLRKWLKAHPKFLSNSLYIGGDSYSGKSVPVIVQEITNGNEQGNEPPLNLKGFVLGNPATHGKYDYNSRIAYAHQKEIISDELYKSIKKNCKGKYTHPDRSNVPCISDVQAVNETFEKLYAYNIREPNCSTWDLSTLLGQHSTDVLSTPQLRKGWCREYMLLFSDVWANDRSVQSALNVREKTVQKWKRCNTRLRYSRDVVTSIEYHRNFTGTGYRALVYSGDYDLAIPYLGTHAWIKSLNLKVAKDWQPWFFDGQAAGYVITYWKSKYSVTFATVKGGGHTTPEYKPKECLAMISRWLAYDPL